jgi:two-component system response regulator ResD
MKEKILLIEDEPSILEVCKRYLEREGFEIFTANDGLEGWQQFCQHQPDLVILDLMLPKKDGWRICEEIRLQSDTPIIMLTALGEERERILGLTIGADDYLTKPFSPRELVLRVQVILRRIRNKAHIEYNSVERLLDFKDLTINPTTRSVYINKKRVELTVKEFEVLYVMAKHPKQVFSRMQLMDLIWESQYEVDTNVVTVLVSRLREKLETKLTSRKWIHTVWGIGYRFDPNGGMK